jgi:hypothetical protein
MAEGWEDVPEALIAPSATRAVARMLQCLIISILPDIPGLPTGLVGEGEQLRSAHPSAHVMKMPCPSFFEYRTAVHRRHTLV